MDADLDDDMDADMFADSEVDTSWLLLVYRVPSQPSRSRVAVWRDLKRLGALYLQQAVCVLPDRPPVRAALQAVRQKITEADGSSFFAVLTDLADADQSQLVTGFRANSAKEYAEIVEECETKFVKEIEFERFRQNYTFEETEEISQDLDKLRRWLDRVIARDWAAASGRAEAEAKVAHCASLLEDFEAEVWERSGEMDDPAGPSGHPGRAVATPTGPAAAVAEPTGPVAADPGPEPSGAAHPAPERPAATHGRDDRGG